MRAREIAVAFDQLCNAILGGYSSETISARCWRLREFRPYGTIRRVIDRLVFWQTDHCKSSFDALVERRNMPAEYQNPSPHQTAHEAVF